MNTFTSPLLKEVYDKGPDEDGEKLRWYHWG